MNLRGLRTGHAIWHILYLAPFGTSWCQRLSQPFAERLVPYESSGDSVYCHREVFPNSSICLGYGHLKVAHATYLLQTCLTSFRLLENCSQRLKRGASRHVITHINHSLPSMSTIPLPPPGTLVPGTSTPLMGACKTTLAPVGVKG